MTNCRPSGDVTTWRRVAAVKPPTVQLPFKFTESVCETRLNGSLGSVNESVRTTVIRESRPLGISTVKDSTTGTCIPNRGSAACVTDVRVPSDVVMVVLPLGSVVLTVCVPSGP